MSENKNAIPPIYITLLVKSLQLTDKQIRNTIHLLNEGATIPFISRYRKEMTDGMDEVQVGELKEAYEKLEELNKRKTTILKSIEDQEKLTSELQERINNCWNSNELEDIYLPFKPKRRTRAEIARENGLEPLAKLLMRQQSDDVIQLATPFVKNKIETEEDALAGARDIIAEWVNENEIVRNAIRQIFTREAIITSKIIKGKETDAQKYHDYFDTTEKLSRCTSHRLLAMRRGETEGFLRVNISPDDEHCLERLERLLVKGETEAADQVYEAIQDAYKRLLKPSIENEFASESKEKADKDAIKVFAENLRQLLLAAPLGQKTVLGIDPGFRTGCKVVCISSEGDLLHNSTIYPHPPQNDYQGSILKMQQLVKQYGTEAIAIGNGTASRETETFVQNIPFEKEVKIFVVSENGASIYSASKIARDEFPEQDVTVRGAVSIARRLMDPLAELVKIDPKSIGVGQYQHDVDQNQLKKALDQTVENAVNKVGVNLNTASKHLLTYISGLGPQLSQNIVDYRAENGAFKSRKDLLKVPKMGAKTYEQSAGFLRIPSSENILDNTVVHPESYAVVEKMAKDANVNISELIKNKELRKSIDLKQYTTDKIGLPTLNDIMQELEKPGRDPRNSITEFQFDPSVKTIADIRTGQTLPGIITNITNFGAFVDIGVKINGLIHISQMSDKFIKNPAEVVSLHQHVMVEVIEVDTIRQRIQLKKIKP